MTDVLLLRDVPEERRLSMERFADELERALSAFPRISVNTMAPHESRLAAQLGLRRLDSYVCRFVRYPIAARKRRADVYHIIDHGYAHVAAFLPRHRTVVTCHDLMLLRAAEGTAGFRPLRRSVARFRWSTGFLKSVGHVACDSEATRKDVIRLLGVDGRCTSVIPLGVNGRFRRLEPTIREHLARELRGSRRHVILHVTTGDPYKNVQGTLCVTRRLLDLGHEVVLVRVGPALAGDDLQLARELRLGGAILECGRVTDERLVELYNASDCLLFPSLWEGYGWPPLEAMACGTPVVTSNAASVLEIVKDAGLTAPATNVHALSDAVASILASPDHAKDLCERGMRQASQFRWEQTAAAYALIYERLMGAGSAEGQSGPRGGA